MAETECIENIIYLRIVGRSLGKPIELNPEIFRELTYNPKILVSSFNSEGREHIYNITDRKSLIRMTEFVKIMNLYFEKCSQCPHKNWHVEIHNGIEEIHDEKGIVYREYTERTPTFHKLFKKRGFYETIIVLGKAQNHSMHYILFVEALNEMGSYINAFYRVKSELFKYGLISFYKTHSGVVSRKGNKGIRLTPKGKIIYKELKTIVEILSRDNNKKRKVKNNG